MALVYLIVLPIMPFGLIWFSDGKDLNSVWSIMIHEAIPYKFMFIFLLGMYSLAIIFCFFSLLMMGIDIIRLRDYEKYKTNTRAKLIKLGGNLEELDKIDKALEEMKQSQTIGG